MSFLAPFHILSYAIVYGTSVYQSFVSGIIAYKTLPLEQFGNLQSRVFPVYFAIQTFGSVVIALTAPYQLKHCAAIGLSLSFVSALINSTVFVRQAQHVKQLRDAQVEIEGKSYKDPTASEDMKALNKRFMRIHSFSMAMNLFSLFGLTFHGVVLARFLDKGVAAVLKV